jgi:molecular chaperone GrpE
MSESPPPGFPANAIKNDQASLTPEAIESILADFRSWLQQLAAAPTVVPPSSPAERVDLASLVGHFVALRHEVNLQTRAARTQQEQNAETLKQLAEALAALEESAAEKPDPAEEHLRPLLKTLIDLYDALSLTGRELERVRSVLAHEEAPSDLAAVAEKLAWVSNLLPQLTGHSFASRFFGGSSGRTGIHQAQETLAEQRRLVLEAQDHAEKARSLFDSLVTGFQMSLQRVERALEECGLEMIPSVGESFDPELMEALDVVTGSDYPPGQVVEEVRPGYLWNGRVFRFALVRVARD